VQRGSRQELFSVGTVSYHRIVFSLELGHRYADDLEGLSEQIHTELAWVPTGVLATSVRGVLIDDYNADLPGSRQDTIDRVFKQAELDYVAFEADGAAVALELLDRAGPRVETFADGRRLRRSTRAEQSTVVVAERHRLSCPTLAATWVLARLGVEPYTSAYTGGEGDHQGIRLITVLPVRYMAVECTVRNLLEAAGYAKHAKKVSYVFY
jgi:hypothetical protein